MNTTSFPRPDYKRTLEIADAVNSDIRDVIEKNYEAAVKQTREFAKSLQGGNAYDTAHNIWKFLKEHITYDKDSSQDQLVRLPSRFVADGHGDCKSYSLFTASILGNLGMPVAFRYASYSGSGIPTHVYTVTKDEQGKDIIIDGVWNLFNSEKTPTHKFDKPMRVYTLSGIGNAGIHGGNMAGFIGWVTAFKDFVTRGDLPRAFAMLGVSDYQKEFGNLSKDEFNQKVRKKIEDDIIVKMFGLTVGSNFFQSITSVAEDLWRLTKVLLLAIPRSAYRLLLTYNVFGSASDLDKANRQNPGKVQSTWESLGGSYGALKDSIDAGKNKASIFGVQRQPIGALPAAVVSALAAAGPILAAMGPVIKAIKGDGDNTVEKILKAAGEAAKAGAPIYKSSQYDSAIVQGGGGAPESPTSFSFNKILPIALIGIGAYIILK